MSSATAQDLLLLADFLPVLDNKKILQLGCDEQCTKVLSDKKADTVYVVDHNQEGLDRNKEANDSCENVQYSKKSLSGITSECFKVDMIYSDSKFIHFSDELIVAAVERSLSLLNDGGLLLLREPFDTNKPTSTGLTPTKFIDLIQSKIVEEQGLQYGYDLIFVKPNKALTLLSSLPDTSRDVERMSFLFTKVKIADFNGFKTLKEFMDNKQYTRNGVLRYEKIFGAGFVSTGGLESTSRFFENFDLKPGQKVLDVGCGIGGGDFLLAEKFGVDVLAMDLSANMIGIAWERAVDYQDLNVRFEIGDIKTQDYPKNTFDFIYSRDTLLHIDCKNVLFARFKDWLKPGGKVFITDYCCGPKPWSDNYEKYVEQRGYNLMTVPEYGKLFTDLGFVNVQAENVTDTFVEMLKAELVKFEAMKTEFIDEFSEKDYEDLINGWNEKLVRCADGHQVWGKFYCEKAE